MEAITLEALETLLKTRFRGVLHPGRHEGDGECCALELLAVAQGLEWTDDPEVVRTFDLRPLNDILVSDAVRTQHLLPVVTAYAGSLDWPLDRQRKVGDQLLIETVRRLLGDLPGLMESVRQQCRNASTVGEARLAVAAVARDAEAMTAVAGEMVAAVAVGQAEAMAASAVARLVAAAVAVLAKEVVKVAMQMASEVAAKLAAAVSAWSVAAMMAVEAAFIVACEIWMEAVKQ
jgi:hypothetical protein